MYATHIFQHKNRYLAWITKGGKHIPIYDKAERSAISATDFALSVSVENDLLKEYKKYKKAGNNELIETTRQKMSNKNIVTSKVFDERPNPDEHINVGSIVAIYGPFGDAKRRDTLIGKISNKKDKNRFQADIVHKGKLSNIMTEGVPHKTIKGKWEIIVQKTGVSGAGRTAAGAVGRGMIRR